MWIEDGILARPLYIKSVDDTLKRLTLKFKGAPSGTYKILLTSAQKGRLDGDDITLETKAVITGITPTEGSALGGTVLIITGENFSDNPLDNPVQIGTDDCIV